ncbi:MAG: phosphate regulon transcriptional regulator PhoB [Salaquimonas sp.]
MTQGKNLKALLVEDEPAQMELLRYNFQKDGYQVFSAMDGEEGRLLAEEILPDLIVLDWMLPQLSGIEACRQLKRGENTREIPIIMLTARGEESDKVRGLDTGADDYMVKPYSVAELLARARALIRRSGGVGADSSQSYGDIVIDAEKHRVTRNDLPIKLGPTEYRLLAVFISRPGRVWSREQLLERVWEENLEIDLRTVDVHVGRLRKALTQSGKPNPIRTVRSVGYSLDAD